jgi:hypothetical protein
MTPGKYYQMVQAELAMCGSPGPITETEGKGVVTTCYAQNVPAISAAVLIVSKRLTTLERSK